jgi:hypothetical protein
MNLENYYETVLSKRSDRTFSFTDEDALVLK